MEGSVYDLIRAGGFDCSCGKHHSAALEELIIESGALKRLPGLIKSRGYQKVFILTDQNEYAAAGRQVCGILQEAGIPYSVYIFPQTELEPDEYAVGAAAMHFDESCDLVLAVGSGVINDTAKILANLTKRAYFIAATAPSMDGYASATSSMARSGVKVSLNSMCPSVIVADLDVLCKAPARALQSGMGDMVAKYISICEWRIAQLLIGESFCPEIAQMVRGAVAKCTANADGLAKREPGAVAAVMEGLVVTGIAMSYAGISRPASGMEHYFSHVWDMRTLEFGTPGSTHGIQCGIGTLLSIEIYDYIRNLTPERGRALQQAQSFDLDAWNEQLARFLGKGSVTMIRDEKREGKYDLQKHAARLEKIIKFWPQILQIIEAELPERSVVEKALQAIGAPTKPEQIGIDRETVRTTFMMTKDIRDKYIGSRLLWDLGVLDDAAKTIF